MPLIARFTIGSSDVHRRSLESRNMEDARKEFLASFQRPPCLTCRGRGRYGRSVHWERPEGLRGAPLAGRWVGGDVCPDCDGDGCGPRDCDRPDFWFTIEWAPRQQAREVGKVVAILEDPYG